MKKPNHYQSKKHCTLILLYSFFILLTTFCFGQNDKSDFWENVRFGGGLGLSFGDGFFSGTLAPSAIYQINDQFAAGVGLSGTYNKQKNYYESYVLGGSLIGLYNPIPQLQISAELQELHVNRDYDSRTIFTDETYWYPALFLGVGYRTNNVTFGVMFDVLYDEDKSIYAEPWAPFVRVYF
ncbi:alpha-ketoglutarate decarboxylase [Mangrovimonas aestuarii]|uniref:alpha-ketoglutarate decarboxylase n=1 Tax=Mangrovimonas aestuarii TaxID=3018443 RepID=UPI002379FCF2|nr:alpha-ketoglutarate decarboxylase [Mangrovimonas aestuarii]